jgi:hypothetical protein
VVIVLLLKQIENILYLLSGIDALPVYLGISSQFIHFSFYTLLNIEMKSLAILGLYLASLALSSPLERRQQSDWMSVILGLIPDSYKIAPSSIQEVKPNLRATAIRKIARYGPFVLPPNKV